MSSSNGISMKTSPAMPVENRRELQEEECYDELALSFPTWKKWTILSAIFIVQCSMNFNTSVYASAVSQLSEHFHITENAAMGGQAGFLIAYAFGSELWAPWSEDFGRKRVLALSLFLVNVFQIPAMLAPTWSSVVAARILGGLSSAGGSVTLGMVADMWEPEDQQYAVAFVVFSSVFGTVLGPIAGGFLESYSTWKVNFWVQLGFGVVAMLLHLVLVPETRSSIMMDQIAKERREAAVKGDGPQGYLNVYGPNKVDDQHRVTASELVKMWYRPFHMFITEPIVLCLSLLSGFSDALIFTFLEGFRPVFTQWNFSAWQQGLCFCAIGAGYFAGWSVFIPFINHDRVKRSHKGVVEPESRLLCLTFTAPLLGIGLLGFAWTSMGPPLPWIAPLIFAAVVGLANYAIYMATIDYMVAAYGPFASSATGGNALARDLLAGISAYYAKPLYTNLGGSYHLQWASTLLGVLALLMALPIYIFYWKGPQIRKKSKFAQTLEYGRNEHRDKRRKSLEVGM
ncbi:MAG: hypothetical protein M1828_000991 [Chrysothrix sp. TS-e1954]|nr:MAG: hypothetical protein M1828_000991 [Chrysothrix sp. TS-e1954]